MQANALISCVSSKFLRTCATLTVVQIAFWQGMGVINMLTDLALILFPVHVIVTLQMSTAKKFTILTFFGARSLYVYRLSDQPPNNKSPGTSLRLPCRWPTSVVLPLQIQLATCGNGRCSPRSPSASQSSRPAFLICVHSSSLSLQVSMAPMKSAAAVPRLSWDTLAGKEAHIN